MANTFSREKRSAIMRAVKSKDTSVEMKVRSALHGAGYRYRLHNKKLPGNPDIVLSRWKLIVFVHGCFWHWHGCKRARMPGSNRDYWTAKIQKNIDRDRKNQAALKKLGWTVMIVWECQVEDGIGAVLELLRDPG